MIPATCPKCRAESLMLIDQSDDLWEMWKLDYDPCTSITDHGLIRVLNEGGEALVRLEEQLEAAQRVVDAARDPIRLDFNEKTYDWDASPSHALADALRVYDERYPAMRRAGVGPGDRSPTGTEAPSDGARERRASFQERKPE